MTWFRTNRGLAAWLAFFALACQLTLSFGHVHIGKFGASSPGWAAAQPADESSGDSSPSPQKNPAGPAADFCAVCANISLAGALILPILALILAPGLFIRALPWSLAVHEPTSFDHRPFSARGPPLA